MSVVIQPHEAQKLLNNQSELNPSPIIIDLRTSAEHFISEAVFLTSQQVIRQAESWKGNHNHVFLICQNGEQSKQLAELLGNPFRSIDGGFEQWIAVGLPVVKAVKSEWYKRYQHQINLSGFGEQAQQRLARAHVVVIGAGGLGAPALLYLVAAGVGSVTLVDDDHVTLSNLHRQILYKEDEQGLSKAILAKKALSLHNSQCQINSHSVRLTADNVENLLQHSDLVVDGSDNIATRHVINDYCVKKNIPWIFAAVEGFELQVAMWGLSRQQVCFQCLYPKQQTNHAQNCQQQGVLGTVPAMAAMLQVTEAIKYLGGLELKLQQQMLSYNVLTHRFKMLKYPPDLQCPHR